ncbi:MAG TPA: DUF72 domain-containing protein [Vitreimonas sp.]|nr:DUF72 domain-containing protein [Vitreimonas sp.]
MQIYIGTSGFTLQNFYEPQVKSADKLAYYAQHFTTVEINSTFYHLPRLTTLQKWQQAVGPDFVFTFKVNQDITHQPSYILNQEIVNKWFEVFETFATTDKRHLMLFQFPAHLDYEEKYFKDLVALLPETFKYAFEFRNTSWFVHPVFEVIDKKQATIVIADGPVKRNGQPRWPKFSLDSAPFTYIRMHGQPQLYHSSYSDEKLDRCADFILSRQKKSLATYVYFNNDASGHAVANAQTLQTLLEEKRHS